MFELSEINEETLYEVVLANADYVIGEDFFSDPAQVLDVPDPEPFLVRGLPREILEKFPDPYRNNTPIRWEFFKELEIDRIPWRRTPKHIEGLPISVEVFDQVLELSPRLWDVGYEFTAHGPAGEELRMRIPSTPSDARMGMEPVKHAIQLGEVNVDLAGLKASELGTVLRRRWRKQETELHLDRKRLTGGLFVLEEFPYKIVTTSTFINRWLETDISKRLRSAYFEDDMFFRPFTPIYGSVRFKLI